MRMNPSQQNLPVALQELGLDFHDVFRVADVGIAVATLDGRIIEVNPALAFMLGYDASELTADVEGVRRITHPDDWELDKALFQELVDGLRDHYEIEKRYLKKDGTVLWGCLSLSLVRSRAEHPAYAVAVVQNLNPRKEVEQEALDRARKLAILSRASRRINSELAVPAIMRALVSSALELADGTGGTYGVAHENRMVFLQYFERGAWRPIEVIFTPDRGIPGFVLRTRTSYLTNNAERDPILIPELRREYNVRALVTVPIISRAGELLGCFELHSSNPNITYSDSDVQLLETLAANAAVAIENARLYQKARLEIEAREQSEERFRLAQYTAGTATWDWNLETGDVVWAAGSTELYGRPLKELTHIQKWREAVHPDDVPAVEEALARSMETREPFQSEYRTIWPDGSTHWILGRANVFVDERGRPTRMLGINMDITARKLAEQALHASEDRFHRAQAAAKIGAFEWDLQSGKMSWFYEVPTLRGFAPDGRFETWAKHLHPEDRDRICGMIEKAIAASSDFDVEGRMVKQEGETVWIRSMGHLLRDQNGPSHFVGITMDITDRKLAEEALRNSEKLAATGRMAATIAHEINNPLEAVTNLIYLARNTASEPMIRNWLESAEQELARVSHITKQTLGFYRDRAAPRRVDFSELVEDIVTLYGREMGKKNLRLTLKLEPGAEVIGLSGELKQVISNLLSNAIDASPHKGPLHVRVRTTDNFIRFTVCDRGYGVRPEFRKRIFEPFFTTKREIGTGLGLWVTKGIVEKHKGHISLRSNSEPGRSGTVFSVRLPRARQGAGVQAA